MNSEHCYLTFLFQLLPRRTARNRQNGLMGAHALQSLDGQSSEQTLGRLKLPSPHPMPELTFDRRGCGALINA